MNDYAKQSAYTAYELVEFLSRLQSRLHSELPATKAAVATDVLAAVCAAVTEYGLNANYVSSGVGRKAGSSTGGYFTRTVIDRNIGKLIDLEGGTP